VGTQASIDIASADDGLTPILEGVSSFSVAAKNASISIDLIKVDTLLSSIQSTDNVELTSVDEIALPQTVVNDSQTAFEALAVNGTTPATGIVTANTVNALSVAFDEASISETTATVAPISDTAIASDSKIEDVKVVSQQTTESSIAQDSDIIEASDAATLSIDAGTSATDADDITTIEETSATATEAISIALARIESVETSLTASAITDDGEQASADSFTTPISASAVSQTTDAFTASFENDVVSTAETLTQQSDDLASAVDEASIQTVAASPQTIDADTIAIDGATVVASVATPQTINATTIALDASIIDATVETTTIDAATSALDADNISTTVATVTEINAETRALDQAAVSTFDNSSSLIDAETAAQDAATRSTPVASTALIDADTSSQDVALVAASDITPLRGTDAIEIASAISLIDPKTSVASIIASADEQTFATDAAVRDDTNVTVAQINAETSALDISAQSSASAPSIPSFDEDTSAVEDLLVSTPRVDSLLLDAQTTALEEGIVSQQIATTFVSIEDTAALEEGLLSGASVAGQQTTDEIEITSAISVISPESLDATPIISGDEDTAAFEGGVLSLLRANDIVVDAGTSSIEEGVISEVLSVEPSPDEISTAQEEGEISISSISGYNR
jgi:hypothetical protein